MNINIDEGKLHPDALQSIFEERSGLLDREKESDLFIFREVHLFIYFPQMPGAASLINHNGTQHHISKKPN